MKRVIRIDKADGEVIINGDSMSGYELILTLGPMSFSFALHGRDFRALGEAMVEMVVEDDEDL